MEAVCTFKMVVSTHGYPQNLIQAWKYPSLRQACKTPWPCLQMEKAIVTGAWNVFSVARLKKEKKSVLDLFTSIR
ncbi:fizzy-related protein homolog [Zootermopsis nevadensis]|uniref:Fizzy-related protein-like protein n=1 Tax=Zootermopsis nevadensis TaxID=136037 RepID=A0A067QWL2_ZOONE|nr:fizzy-related protein homolog [Zootermopsis nevadensis]KDR14723.1 Fizzy-related protein-like protein [Zootermopsis nevadensis]